MHFGIVLSGPVCIAVAYSDCRSVLRQVNCRYATALRACGRQAAEWQKAFSQQLSGVFPNLLKQIVHPDGQSVTLLKDCSTLKSGMQMQYWHN